MNILVVDTGTEAVVHQRTQCEPGHLVDELGRPVLADSVAEGIIFLIPVIACDTVEDPSLAVSDTLHIDGTADQLSVLDADVSVELAVLLLTFLVNI